MTQVIIQNLMPLFSGFLTTALFLGFYIHKIRTLEKKVDKIDSISDRLAKIEGGLERDRAHGGLVKAKSPLTLTDKGEKVLSESGGKDYVDNNKESLLQEIKAKNPKSSYDVQELSKVILESHQNDEGFIAMKEYAFKKGILLEHIIMALSIYFRDFALDTLGFKISNEKED